MGPQKETFSRPPPWHFDPSCCGSLTMIVMTTPFQILRSIEQNGPSQTIGPVRAHDIRSVSIRAIRGLSGTLFHLRLGSWGIVFIKQGPQNKAKYSMILVTRTPQRDPPGPKSWKQPDGPQLQHGPGPPRSSAGSPRSWRP